MSAMRGQSSGRAPRMVTRGRLATNVAVLRVVVEEELGRVRTQPDDVHLVLALPVDPGEDQLLVEHPALRQERVVGLERVERLTERARNLCDLAVRFLEEIEVRRRTGVE